MTGPIMDIVRKYVEQIIKGDRGRTLEIGSRNVNGSVRSFFSKDYVGIDMRPGKGVDRVMNSHDLSLNFESESFDTIIWLETLEHDETFWRTLEEIEWVLRPGGYLIVSCPTIGFPRHDHPSDYWRLTEDGLREILSPYEIIDIRSIPEGPNPKQVIGIARKHNCSGQEEE